MLTARSRELIVNTTDTSKLPSLPNMEFLSAFSFACQSLFSSIKQMNIGCMKISSILLITALLCSVSSDAEFRLQLKTRTVYILPMANGLDRHLASRLTSSGVVWVVLQPENADAVLTDRVDEAFWVWSNARYKAATKSPSVTFNDEDRSRYERPRIGGYRGTVFLVDPRAGLVLWSIYEPTPKTSADALDQAAVHVAVSLKKSLNAK
jgi:hypothetical protein